MTTGSFSDYARHIGASPAYVNKLKQQGRLVIQQENGRDLVNFEMSDRLVRNTTDMGRAGNGRNATGKEESSRPVAPLAENEKIDATYRKAKAHGQAFAAKIEELKYKELAGELIRLDAVRAAMASKITATRDALLQIPARLAPLLAVETDVDRVIELLEDELRVALAQISDPNNLEEGA
jgi:hypothetical protein